MLDREGSQKTITSRSIARRKFAVATASISQSCLFSLREEKEIFFVSVSSREVGDDSVETIVPRGETKV
jgi:hypothetical protein